MGEHSRHRPPQGRELWSRPRGRRREKRAAGLAVEQEGKLWRYAGSLHNDSGEAVGPRRRWQARALQDKLAVWFVPAKNEQTGVSGTMVVGGFASQPQGAPGAYGVYVPAKIAMVRTSRSEGPGSTTVEETWEISTEAGDQLRFAIAYERGIGTRVHVEPRIYAATKPEFYRIYKVDQITDIVHSVAADTGRTKKFGVHGFRPADL